MPALKVEWHPNFSDNKQPGSHFYVQYRRKGETQFENSPHELNENFILLRGLDTNQLYEIRVVSVDGDFSVYSETEEVVLYATTQQNSLGNGPYIVAPSTVASTGWFIGMMLALALLLLVLVLVCIIKRNRGGKYAVHEREATHGRKDFIDDAGFHEYSQPYVQTEFSFEFFFLFFFSFFFATCCETLMNEFLIFFFFFNFWQSGQQSYAQ